MFYFIIFTLVYYSDCECAMQKYGLFQPSVYHALIVIFLEFFSWGLVISPVILVCSVSLFL